MNKLLAEFVQLLGSLLEIPSAMSIQAFHLPLKPGIHTKVDNYHSMTVHKLCKIFEGQSIGVSSQTQINNCLIRHTLQLISSFPALPSIQSSFSLNQPNSTMDRRVATRVHDHAGTFVTPQQRVPRESCQESFLWMECQILSQSLL